MVLPSLLYAPGLLLTGVLEVTGRSFYRQASLRQNLGVYALVLRRKLFRRLSVSRGGAALTGLTAGAVLRWRLERAPEERQGHIYTTVCCDVTSSHPPTCQVTRLCMGPYLALRHLSNLAAQARYSIRSSATMHKTNELLLIQACSNCR